MYTQTYLPNVNFLGIMILKTDVINALRAHLNINIAPYPLYTQAKLSSFFPVFASYKGNYVCDGSRNMECNHH